VGSHGYHGLDYLLGTNASKVANLAHRDVFVVHDRPSDPQSVTYRQMAR
jgi:nucleotide-binding universal stress UspA family protein